MWKWNYSSKQIWAKWTISQETLGKQYLTKDLYDPELWDMKVGSDKMIDKGIGRYVYAVYKKPTGNDWGNDNNTWTYYNIAYTVKKDWTEDYETKIVWRITKFQERLQTERICQILIQSKQINEFLILLEIFRYFLKIKNSLFWEFF